MLHSSKLSNKPHYYATALILTFTCYLQELHMSVGGPICNFGKCTAPIRAFGLVWDSVIRALQWMKCSHLIHARNTTGGIKSVLNQMMERDCKMYCLSSASKLFKVAKFKRNIFFFWGNIKGFNKRFNSGYRWQCVNLSAICKAEMIRKNVYVQWERIDSII